jgi:hypothetical protein
VLLATPGRSKSVPGRPPSAALPMSFDCHVPFSDSVCAHPRRHAAKSLAHTQQCDAGAARAAHRAASGIAEDALAAAWPPGDAKPRDGPFIWNSSVWETLLKMPAGCRDCAQTVHL